MEGLKTTSPSWGRTRTLGIAVFLLCLIATPGEAWSCRLALVLAIDVSRSVDSREYRQQLQGLAQALRDEEVQAVLLDRGAPVALASFEWSSPGHQRLITDWALLLNIHHVEVMALQLDRTERSALGHHTAIGAALVYAKELLERAPDCAQQVIDLSSDGYNNQGPTPEAVYASNDFSAISVNALVVSGLKRPVLQQYFEERVIHGFGAFAVPTESYEDYAEAIKRKLLRELRRSDKLADAQSAK